MKIRVLLTATVLGSLFVSTQALAGASANIGATTNYLWRGVTQSDDNGAIQGGLDYAADNGLYVGTWLSSMKAIGGKNGTEVDVYAGYKKELANGFAYDVGAVRYQYPNNAFPNFSEAYVKGSYKGVGAEVDYTLAGKGTDFNQKGDVYYGLGYTGKIKDDLSYGAKVGRYNYKNAGQDYSNAQLFLTKTAGKAGDFTLAIDKANQAAVGFNGGKDDARVSLTWKKSFDF